MALVKLTEEELIEKRAELGRVLKDITAAESAVTEAKERVKLATEHVDGLLKQLLSLVEESKLAFELIDCTLTAPITGELPAPATPSTPEEIVARSKWLHVVLTQEPEQPWQIACESDEKKDAIAAFNSAWKAAKKSGGRVLRFEHKTLKREFPTPKEETEQAQATG